MKVGHMSSVMSVITGLTNWQLALGIVETVQTIAEILRDNIHKAGTQQQFAETIGVDPSTVSHWLKGTRQPHSDRWQLIELALDLERHTLAKAKDIPGVPKPKPVPISQRLSDIEDRVAALELRDIRSDEPISRSDLQAIAALLRGFDDR